MVNGGKRDVFFLRRGANVTSVDESVQPNCNWYSVSRLSVIEYSSD